LNNVKEEFEPPVDEDEFKLAKKIAKKMYIFYLEWLEDACDDEESRVYNNSMLAQIRLNKSEIREEFDDCYASWRITVGKMMDPQFEITWKTDIVHKLCIMCRRNGLELPR
jgi:hypothetical protein